MRVELVLPTEAKKPEDLGSFLKGLPKDSLFQNVMVLLLGALVTGLAVPRIKAGMDLRYFKQQKVHESLVPVRLRSSSSKQCS